MPIVLGTKGYIDQKTGIAVNAHIMSEETLLRADLFKECCARHKSPTTGDTCAADVYYHQVQCLNAAFDEYRAKADEYVKENVGRYNDGAIIGRNGEKIYLNKNLEL